MNFCQFHPLHETRSTKQTRKPRALSKAIMDLFDIQQKRVGCNLHEYLNNLRNRFLWFLRFYILGREGVPRWRFFRKINFWLFLNPISTGTLGAPYSYGERRCGPLPKILNNHAGKMKLNWIIKVHKIIQTRPTFLLWCHYFCWRHYFC